MPTARSSRARKPGAVIHDTPQVIERSVRLATEGRRAAMTGEIVEMRADTLCLHGDTPDAVALATRAEGRARGSRRRPGAARRAWQTGASDMSDARPRFLPAGDSALVVEFGDTIDPAINRAGPRSRPWPSRRHARIPGVCDLVPTYRSLLVYYDPRRCTPSGLRGRS